MRSPMGFSRPLHLRAGGPRTQVGSWVHSDGFQPPTAPAGQQPAHPGGGALRGVAAAHRICGLAARAPRGVQLPIAPAGRRPAQPGGLFLLLPQNVSDRL